MHGFLLNNGHKQCGCAAQHLQRQSNMLHYSVDAFGAVGNPS